MGKATTTWRTTRFDRTDIGRAVPDPSLRYPRILLPGMAHLLALGRAEWVDASLLCSAT